MARLLIIVTLCAATLGGYRLAAAQSNHVTVNVQSPLLPLVDMRSVACPSENVCQAAGDTTIFTTRDGGATWHHHRIGKINQIGQVVCVSTSACFVLAQVYQGRTGQTVVMRTENGGQSWQKVSSFVQSFVGGASCPTPTVCYAMAGSLPGIGSRTFLLRSTDAGATWTRLKGQTLYQVSPESLTCTGPALCYLGGLNGMLITRDAGRTWRKRAFAAVPSTSGIPPPPLRITGVSCVGVDVCYAVMGNGRILGTRDGWTTSRQLRAAESVNGPPLNRIACSSVSACFVVGYSPAILATTDAGATWKTLQTATANPLESIACASPSTCTAVGQSTTILSTHDGGMTWRSGIPGITSMLLAVACVDVSACTAVGASGTIAGTVNGGQTWKSEDGGVHRTLDAVSCPSATVCYAVGGSRIASLSQGPVGRDTLGPAILRTDNGGTTWNLLAEKPIGGRSLALAAIACPAVDICYAASDSGAILSTRNGGQNWSWARTGSYFQLRGIACPTTSRCIAVGGLPADCGEDSCDSPEEGVIFTTQDGGGTWERNFYRRADLNQNSPSSPGALLSSVSCPALSTCFAAGRNLLLGTVDGGKTWHIITPKPTAQPSPQPGTNAAVLACPSTTTCWESNGFPGFLYTHDGGQTWVTVAVTRNLRAGPITSLTCPVVDACYAVGGSGLIIRLDGSPASNVERVARGWRTTQGTGPLAPRTLNHG